ncbi:MAG: uroporphyrinogen decarboxylase family protein [bacterium]
MTTTRGFSEFDARWQSNAQLARDTIALRPTQGIPTWLFQTMQWSQLESLSGNPPGSYPKEPGRVCLDFMLKGPYGGFFTFPGFLYYHYGYENYFMAYALYPEVIERGFTIHADTSVVYNRIAARAILEGHLPRLIRLDHDMADSRGTLVDVKTLDQRWFPHFARAIQPFMDAGIRLIWHCDGNLLEMVPRLLEVGIGGFQGFQYEDGMDYERICQMKTRDGGDLFIIGGVSVTTTLPLGKPAEVKREMDWLVAKGPKVGLMLGCSSSIAPGVPLENMKTLIDGFAHYRQHGRG